MVGGVVSRTVMVCTQLALLLHASVAVHVRAMTLVTPQLVVTSSVVRIVTLPQPSCAVATPVALVVVSAGHSSRRSGGQVKIGRASCRERMVCTQLAGLLKESVAVHVRAMNLVRQEVVVSKSVKTRVSGPHPS